MEWDRAAIARYRRNFQDEVDSAALYLALAETETSPELREVFRRLAEMEQQHAEFWRQKLSEAGLAIPTARPSWRTRVLIWIARRFGPALVLPTVTAREWADQAKYDAQAEAANTGLPEAEHQHARILQLIGRERPSGLPGSALAVLEGRHRAIGGNALRAAVLGANDGLVSNLSLVMGVAGADLAPRTILLTGIAGLLAGSLSMAMGEWLSVQSAQVWEYSARCARYWHHSGARRGRQRWQVTRALLLRRYPLVQILQAHFQGRDTRSLRPAARRLSTPAQAALPVPSGARLATDRVSAMGSELAWGPAME
jgi:hypothetical protein